MSYQPRLPLKQKRAKSDNAEYRLQCALVGHLKLRLMPRVYWTAMANGEKRSAATGARLKAMGLRAGNADLLFLCNGHAYGLELKALRIGAKGAPLKGAGQSEAQILAQRDWTAAGGSYAVATGIVEALAQLEAWGIIRPDRGVIPVYSPRLLTEAA